MYKLFGIAIILMILSVSCAGGGTPRQNNDPIPQSPDQQQQVTPLWIGDGGKGMSLGILMPESQGLNADQAYLPSMVQGVLVSNISKYSTISVLDRVSLDKVIAETLDPTYEDNLDIVRLGHIAHVGNIMTGKIIRTSTGYTLQINVTDTTPNARTIASYSGTCSVAELDNHTAIQKASVELLAQMGVQLTDSAKNELSASNSQSVNAQTALAQGITAQRQGTEVTALSYYFQAAAFDPALAEAASRSSILAANISSGNIGADARNDIAWRKQWTDRLAETEQYLDNFKLLPHTLFYSPEITQGTINYQNETISLSIEAKLYVDTIWLNSVEQALQAVYKAVYDGLKATKRDAVWGLRWPQILVTNLKPFEKQSKSFSIIVELVNDKNQVIGRQSFQTNCWSEMSTISSNISFKISPPTRSIITFPNVNANDITDNLTIQIVSVNGVNTQTAVQNRVLQIESTFPLWKIGEPGTAGGIVFYDKGRYTDGWRYMEMSPINIDLQDAPFTVLNGLYGYDDTNETETGIGTGKRNTEIIVAKLNRLGIRFEVTQLCKAYTLNGYNDWFLPSRDELDLLYKNLKQNGLTNLITGSSVWDTGWWYWSSSLGFNVYSWIVNLQSGEQRSINSTADLRRKARVIRYF